MTNNWRALARMARDRIVTSDPEDLTLVLGVSESHSNSDQLLMAVLQLWSLRLSSLARLRLFNQTAAECTNLFTALNAIKPPTARDWLFERILPFELEVMQSRLKYYSGDHMGYVDVLAALMRKCRNKARESGGLGARPDASAVEMWKERGSRVALILASQLLEMKVSLVLSTD
jgi:hypothetical protein